MSRQSVQPVPQEFFEALSDPTRRSIIELLANRGQMAATDIYHNFDITSPAVSQHLKVLRLADIVHLEKDAQRRIYSLNTDKMRNLQDWVNKMTEQWETRFAELDKVLESEKRKKRR